MNAKVLFGLRGSFSRKVWFFVSLLFIVVLVFSSFVSMFSGLPLFVSGISDKGVDNEIELKNVINNSVKPTVIALNNDIVLTESLVISANKDIMLTSNKAVGFCRLIGASGESTVIVEAQGILRLNGVTVTHVNGAMGSGITVNFGGTFVLSDGEISGNINAMGGGVYNFGSFKMLGGEISNNTADAYQGGGVYVNNGVFEMTGGVISNNIAHHGGGVYNYGGSLSLSGNSKILSNSADYGGGVYTERGNSSLSGGEISGNTVTHMGGGVLNNYGSFEMTGGVISNNIASYSGGGVTNYGIFKMSNGAIFGNTASRYGGGVVNYFGIILANGVYNYGGNISLSGGEISGNTAEYGGGIYSTDGSVSIFGGTVSSNTATRNGGGVYNDFSIDASGKLIYSSCNFKMSGGKILGNTATNSGGGVGVSHFEGLERVFISEGVIFSDNRASVAYNRSTTHDTLYNSQISSKVTWTVPFTQGYNNYDISYTITTQDTTTNNEITDSNSNGKNSNTSNNKTPNNNNKNSNTSNNKTPNNSSGKNANEENFSVLELFVICMSAAFVVIMIVLLISFQKTLDHVEEKMNNPVDN